MRLIIFSLFLTITCALSKSNTKSLTESLGQEVIEIGAPLKGDLEEEPSAEADEDDPTTVSVAPATKKEVKKTTATDGRRKMKDIDVIDGITQESQDEEAKVEKELADMYKDSNDYTEIGEAASASLNTSTTKINGTEKSNLRNRGRDAFKFQPDLNNAKEIERFRTSIDEISCDKSVTRKLDSSQGSSATCAAVANFLLPGVCAFSIFGSPF